jgi:hypothetical protein
VIKEGLITKQLLRQLLLVQIADHPFNTTGYVRNADITGENLQLKRRLQLNAFYH